MKYKKCATCDGTGREIDSIATGAQARLLREQFSVSLREVARRISLSAAYISDLERGNRNWSSSTWHRYVCAVKGEPVA